MVPTDLIALLDKARASLTGKAGDYKYGNPMDRHFFAFTGIAQDALLEQVKTGAAGLGECERFAETRADLQTIMDYLDDDDHVS